LRDGARNIRIIKELSEKFYIMLKIKIYKVKSEFFLFFEAFQVFESFKKILIRIYTFSQEKFSTPKNFL
jgi:hypothetical protein